VSSGSSAIVFSRKALLVSFTMHYEAISMPSGRRDIIDIHKKYELTWRSHSIAAETYQLLQLLDFERTVDQMLNEAAALGRNDLVPEDCPYFGQIWASSRWLATLLDKFELKGKKVLEIGCGLALPSLVASRHGA